MAIEGTCPAVRLRHFVAAVLLLAWPVCAVAQSLDVVHNFDGYSFSGGSNYKLLAAEDGQLYGTTTYGGPYGDGMIFRMTPAGSVTVLHAFAGNPDGGTPTSALIQASDGRFYGTTTYGGMFNRGTTFRMAADGTVTILHAFGGPDGPALPGEILQAADGSFYGRSSTYIDASGSEIDSDVIFRMTADGDVATVHVFNSTEGIGNVTGLIEASDGNFIGTSAFGSNFHGRVFRMASDGTVTILHAFTGGDGSMPWAHVIEGTDGNFYGTTREGGVFDKGTVFRMTPGGAVTVMHSFAGGAEGSEPEAPLLQAANGVFYGTASSDFSSPDNGSVFKVTSAGAFSVLHSFSGGLDGSRPSAAVVQAGNGALYGTTTAGGIGNLGTVFEIESTETVEILHAFNTAGPDARLAQAADGQFYGAQCGGGLHNNGAVFRVGRNGQFAILYSFLGSPDGSCPKGVIQGNDGRLYGTAAVGGPASGGTAYRLTLDGTFTLLHAFGGGSDGRSPMGPLVQAADGHLYGTTLAGGGSNLGTVFRITLPGVFTLIHEFSGGTNGASPSMGLFQATDGMFYGITGPVFGAAAGALFRMTPSGTVTILHPFDSVLGTVPATPMVEGADHNLYGVTYRTYLHTPHSAHWCAVFFQVSPGGTFTRLSSEFARCTEWHEGEPFGTPLYTLTARRNGTFVGTETNSARTVSVLEFDLGGDIRTLRSLSGSEGANVVAPLIEATDGNLYGVAKEGGAFSVGAMFRVRYTPGPPDALTVSATGPSVRLAWTPVAGSVGYTIKRSSTPGAEVTLASGVVTTDYVDTTAVRGQAYYYVVTATNAFGEGTASYEVSFTPGRAIPGDFDGDNKTDIAVYRPATGVWYIRQSSTAELAAITWGGGADVPVAGDYDGDGRIDAAVFRPSTGVWYIRPSSTFTLTAITWGVSTDIPVPGDYDGDGQTDAAVFRPSTGVWYIRQSRTFTLLSILWGNGTDTPVPGDYDGDGQTDVAVRRASTGMWYVRRSSTFTLAASQWGGATDTPVSADYDGDGKADVSVFRPSANSWDLRQSGSEAGATLLWGGLSDVAVPGDYDGDGKADVAIFRPSTGTWYIRLSSSGAMLSGPWGGPTDVPILKRP